MASRGLNVEVEELSTRTESQAASLEQTRASLDELVEAVKSNLRISEEIDTLATSALKDANIAREIVAKSVASMTEIEQRSKTMSVILTTIDAIAFQTNILSLNAAVEAARAGESGRGFSVVATEVRSLAQRCAVASSEIKKLIFDSNDEVRRGVDFIRSADDALSRVVTSVKVVVDRLKDSTNSGIEQGEKLGEIHQAILGLDQITQQNAQMALTAANSCVRLIGQVDKVSQAVMYLKLRQGCADEARRMAIRAVQLIEQIGPEQAIKRLHDPCGDFIDRDLYIAATDRDDYFRIFGADPQKAGRKRAEVFPGIERNTDLTRQLWNCADQNGGWIEFESRHPLTGLMVEKLAFVLPALNGSWAVQCCVNRGDGTRPIGTKSNSDLKSTALSH